MLIFSIIRSQIGRKKYLKDYFIVYTLLFSITCIIIFFTFIVNGKSFIWIEDGLYQHYPALVYFGVWVRGIIKNIIFKHSLTIPMWSFNLGYGSDIVTTLNYYAIGDPLNLLTIIVPSKYTEYLYNFLVILRMYLAGIAFSSYCFYKKKGKMATLAGSFSYVFCGYTIYTAVRHPFFLNPFIYLPFLLIGVERIFEKKKPRMFICMVFLSLVSNFYLFYMLVLAVCFYVLIRFFMIPHKNIAKEFIVCFFRFVGYGIVGVMMGAILFVPVLLLFKTGLRDSSGILYPILYSRKYYLTFIGQYLASGTVGNWTQLGIAVPAVLSVIVMFSSKKKHIVLKSTFILMTCLLFLPVMGSASNGFSYVANRWCWMYNALCSYIMVCVWPEMMRLTKKNEIAMFCTIVIYFVVILLLPEGVSKNSFAAIVLAFMGLFFLKYSSTIYEKEEVRKRRISVFLVMLGIASAVISARYKYSVNEDNYVSEFADSGRALETVTDSPLKAVKKVVKEENFYRSDAYNGNNNANILLKMPSTQYYWSLANGDISQYLLDFSLNSFISNSYKGCDSRTMMETLSSVKYFSSSDKAIPFGFEKVKSVCVNNVEKKRLYNALKKELGVEELTSEQKKMLSSYISNYTVYKNKYVLPLGYTYSTYITEEQYSSMNGLQRQEALMQGILLDKKSEENIADSYKQTDVKFSEQQMEYSIKCGEGVKQLSDTTFLVTKPKAKIKLNFSGKNNSETYLLVKGINIQQLSELDLYRDSVTDEFSMTAYKSLSKIEKNKLKDDAKDSFNWENNGMSISVETDDYKNSFTYRSPYSIYYIGQDEYLVNMGYRDDAVTGMTVSFPKCGVYSFEDMKVISQPMEDYVAQVASLKESVLENEIIKDNYVYGTINLKENKILCLTIPNNNGWTAYVDGEKADILKGNKMYIALSLEPGKHIIELYYITPGLKIGAIFTGIGFILFIFIGNYHEIRRLDGRRRR